MDLRKECERDNMTVVVLANLEVLWNPTAEGTHSVHCNENLKDEILNSAEYHFH
jgi:hypothetical protein